MNSSGMITVTGLQGNALSYAAPIDGQVLKYVGGGTDEWQPANIVFADIKNGLGGSAFNIAGCSAGQTIKWSSLTDTFMCEDISITTAQVTDMTTTGRSLATAVDADVARAAIGAMKEVAPGTSGNVLQSDGTQWISAPLSIGASNFADQAPNQVLAGPTSGGNAAPTFRALVADDIPNLPASKITSGNLNATQMPAFSGDITTSAGNTTATVVGLRGRSIAVTAPSDGQVLKWNQTNNAWEPAADNSNIGTVTSITTGTGLTTADGQPITTSGQIYIKDGGVGTNQIADGAVTTAKIGDGQVTNEKIAAVSDTKITGTIKVDSGNVGIGIADPSAKLDVAGEIKFGNTNSPCNAANEGQQRYNASTKQMEFCNGTMWISGASTGGGGGSLTYNMITSSTTASANHAYVVNSSNFVAIDLPSTCAVGDRVKAIGIGTGGWKLAVTSDQTIIDPLTRNEGYAVYSRGPHYPYEKIESETIDIVELICVVENSKWLISYQLAPHKLGPVTVWIRGNFNTGNTWTVPISWNSSSNTIEVIGAGGRGGGANSLSTAGSGGGGGAYARITNWPLTPGDSVSYQVGSSGDTWFISPSTLLAKAGANGASGSTSASPGGSASSSVGNVKYSGGSGAGRSGTDAGGGGGAGGPSGPGKNGSRPNGGAGDNGNGGAGGSSPGANGQSPNFSYSGGGGAGAVSVSGTFRSGGLGGTCGGGGGGSASSSSVYSSGEGSPGGPGCIIITWDPR